MRVICLVTGGGGFVGRHLAEALSKRGANVYILDDFSRHLPFRASASDIEVISGDVRDKAQLERSLRGCDIVFHLAAEATVMGCEQDPIRANEVNVAGTYNVLRSSIEAGVRRVVFASSREVYGDATRLPVHESADMRPKNVYGATKAAAEMYCSWARSFIEVAVLRLSNVIGPGDTNRVIPRFIEAATSGAPLAIYGGDQVLDFVGVDVVAAAFVRAGLGSYVPEPVNIGSGRGIQLLEAAERVLQECRSTSRLQVLATRAAEVSKFVADTGRMQSRLGMVPDSDPLRLLSSLCHQEERPAWSTVEGTHATAPL